LAHDRRWFERSEDFKQWGIFDTAPINLGAKPPMATALGQV